MSLAEYQESNVRRFEMELGGIQRPGVDKLLDYIRKSDFYTAPASTKYHLSVPGGLLQHSLNVLDALRCSMHPATAPDGSPALACQVAGYVIGQLYSPDTVTVSALLHDVCKTYFYTQSMRNVKNEKTGQWEKKPYYTVLDRMPLGHGPKSVMLVKQFMPLLAPEMYAIWHHMGPGEGVEAMTFFQAAAKHPLVWALHSADVMATYFMEETEDNSKVFQFRVLYGDGPAAAGRNQGPQGNAPQNFQGPPAEEEPPLPEEPPARRSAADFEEAPPIG